MSPLLTLALASATLVATHLTLSHPLRPPLVRLLGERGFLLVYSAIALAAVWWMARAFRAAPAGDLGQASGVAGWVAASILTVPALALFLGSLRANPALPRGAAADLAGRRAQGVFRVTRHPMMWGFALWAAAHIALLWSWRTMIVAAAVMVLALVGAAGQDRKKRRLLGDGWRAWEERTTFAPRLRALPAIGWPLWIGATVLWLAVTWAHRPLGGVPAGLWLWTG
ncbi:MFS transporter [Erythrobacteraceae bacterium CFH 75059]|uniref:NnrU family protein n=1 Tax=Qipengyuania thermophila TaxID=2509361 RepID=UPI00101F7819|nr:NnrU family protein [Qipengyuania thermophila]TCD06598.1 MFS transporter [Erythrobacteraceae bacterium CFH 75059]